jgi:hypothetical protein
MKEDVDRQELEASEFTRQEKVPFSCFRQNRPGSFPPKNDKKKKIKKKVDAFLLTRKLIFMIFPVSLRPSTIYDRCFK